MTLTETTPGTANPRVEAIFDDVIDALNGIIEKHQVTWAEYRTFTDWLTLAGSQGYEIPLMLDVFLSTTVDNVNAAGVGTESNVEGPFYAPDAPLLEAPYVLPKRADEPGDALVFSGTVRGTDGAPLAGAMLDIWQGNGVGQYSNFHPEVPEYNLRGRLVADADGRFEFETVVPVGYQIPGDGATGMLLDQLGRPNVRPAHIHFLLTHDDAQPLTTQVYFDGDPWIDCDVVGAVKAPLVTKLEQHVDAGGSTSATCHFDFVLAPRS